jgi:Protein of unknown function (DUF3723)
MLTVQQLIQHYLEEIFDTLKQIFGGRTELFGTLDSTTAKRIHSRAPGSSKEDLASLQKDFEKCELFPSANESQDRQMIWENLQGIKTLIPTLYTLFEDMKYLKEPATVMRRLFGLFGKGKGTIREEMYHNFDPQNLEDDECLIEESENIFKPVQCSSDDRFEIGYRQVWLYAWRHWSELIPAVPRKEKREKMPVPQEPDPAIWHQLANMAYGLGFNSNEIARRRSRNPDREGAENYLLRAWPPEEFEYDKESLITQITYMIKLATKKKQQKIPIKPPLLISGLGEDIERRYGRAFNKAYEADRKHLFLGTLYNPREGEGGGISSFLVRSSVYFAFFGRYGANTIVTALPGAASMNLTEAIKLTMDNIAQNKTGNSTSTSKFNDRVETDFGPLVPFGIGPPQADEITSIPTPLPPDAQSVVLDEDLFEEDIIPTLPEMPKIIVQFWDNGKLLNDKAFTIECDRSALNAVFSHKDCKSYPYVLDTSGRVLRKKRAFDAVIRNRMNTIVLSTTKVKISPQLVAATVGSVLAKKRHRNEDLELPLELPLVDPKYNRHFVSIGPEESLPTKRRAIGDATLIKRVPGSSGAGKQRRFVTVNKTSAGENRLGRVIEVEEEY